MGASGFGGGCIEEYGVDGCVGERRGHKEGCLCRLSKKQTTDTWRGDSGALGCWYRLDIYR